MEAVKITVIRMLMVDRTKTVSNKRSGRSLVRIDHSLFLAVVFFVLSCLAVGADAAKNLIASQSQSLLIARATPDDKWCARHLSSVRMALALDPLNSNLVNGYTYCSILNAEPAVAGRTADAAEAALSLIGWRSTTVLQNRLTLATRTQSVPLILNVVDALLRRNQLNDQLIPLMNSLEASQAGRRIVKDKIRANVPWVDRYLSDPKGLATETVITGRAILLEDLMKSGREIPEAVIIPSLEHMVARGYVQIAGQLWRMHGKERVASEVLHDTDFSRFSSFSATDQLRSPFDWYGVPRAGISVVTVPGENRYIEISWDGKGQPAFLAQQTVGAAGTYKVQVIAEGLTTGLALAFNVVAKCDNGADYTGELRKTRGPGGLIAFESILKPECSDFIVEIRGYAQIADVRISPTPVGGNVRQKLHLKRITMRKIVTEQNNVALN